MFGLPEVTLLTITDNTLDDLNSGMEDDEQLSTMGTLGFPITGFPCIGLGQMNAQCKP